MKYLNTILIIIILIMGAIIYYNSTNKQQTHNETIITKIDTLYIYKEAKIDTVWYTETKLDTIFIETILQGDTIITTLTDTIFVKEKDIIVSIDTTFISRDSLVKSDVYVKYSYNNKSFKINNKLTYRIQEPKSNDSNRFPLGGILYTSGSENSLELGIGLSYKLTDNSNIFVGYSTSKNIMIGFGVSLP